MGEETPSIIDIVCEDQERLQALVEAVAGAAVGPAREEATSRLRELLAVHTSVVDAKATAMESAEQVAELLRSHRQLTEQVDAARKCAPDSGAWERALEGIRRLAGSHAREEEGLLARWRQRFTSQELDEIGVEAVNYRKTLEEPAVG